MVFAMVWLDRIQPCAHGLGHQIFGKSWAVKLGSEALGWAFSSGKWGWAFVEVEIFQAFISLRMGLAVWQGTRVLGGKMKGHRTQVLEKNFYKVRRRKGDFRQDFGGGACGQGDFRRLYVVARMNTLSMSMNMMNTLNIGMNLLNMSESSNRESHDPLAFGGEDTKSEEPSQYCMRVRGEPSIDSREVEYREMQRNYRVLEVVADRVLALPHTPEVGSSNQASPSGSVGVAVASASEGVVPPSVGLRLPSAIDVVRYPPEGCVLIFTDMYQHGFRLLFHPWVQMMLAKLGYAPGQYNPNFWLFFHGVYIAWWLAGLRETMFEQFMYLYSIFKQQGSFGSIQANCRKAKEKGYFIGHKPSTQKSWRNRWCLAYGDWECQLGKTVSKHIPTHFQSISSVKWGPISKEEEDEVGRVRSLLSETERECKNLVTQKNLLESGLLQEIVTNLAFGVQWQVSQREARRWLWIWMMPRCRDGLGSLGRRRLRRGGSKQATGKRPRDDDEDLVVDVLGKKRALEEAHQSVMGTGSRLPLFDLQALPKLPFGMDVYVEGVENVDFSRLRRWKNKVNLAMHRQEVPLVNVFLEGVKSDPEVLARTPASSYADLAQKTFLTHAYAYDEMYVNMAKANKEIQRWISVGCVVAVSEWLKYVDKEPCRTSLHTGYKWVMDVLNGHKVRCHEQFRMEKHVFIKLVETLTGAYGLKEVGDIPLVEALSMFLIVLGHGFTNRMVQERFQHSGEMVSRWFGITLDVVCRMAGDIISPQDPQFGRVPDKIKANDRY
ncbi:unnamed protein product [Prunus armeniaca]